MSAVAVAGLSTVGPGPRMGGSSATSGGLSRAGASALTGIADPPSPSKPGSMEDAIKLWLKIGNVEKLQQAVLDGYGWFLKDQSSRLSNVNKFLRKVPEFQEKIDTIHDMTIRGDINRLKALMDRRGWAQVLYMVITDQNSTNPHISPNTTNTSQSYPIRVMEQLAQETTSVEFSCNGADNSVQVAGTWNNWVPQDLSFNGDYWSVFISLLPGTFQYKYIVDGVWLHDPSKKWVDDGFGNINNLITVESKLAMFLRQKKISELHRTARRMRKVQSEIRELKQWLGTAWYTEIQNYKLCPKAGV